MTEEFNFKQELRNIFEKELLGRTTNAGRIYRKLLTRDKEFIKKLKENTMWKEDWHEFIKEIDKLAGKELSENQEEENGI